MYKPVDMENKLDAYMYPIEIKLRNRFLEIAKKHGNGVWSFETLEWEVYIDNIDRYESLNEEEKYILNSFMKAFRSLYK